MAVSPKEFYKLREENKCLRQIVSNKVVEFVRERHKSFSFLY